MTEAFDVFLSHNSRDKPAVRELASALKLRGLRVWLDEAELVPGRPWQAALETVIQTTRTAAVLIGKDGLGPWEEPEMRACLSECVNRKMPVIPVLLPDAPHEPELPYFLRSFTWVDLRGGLADGGVDRLVWGIAGVKPTQAFPPKPPRRGVWLAVVGIPVLSLAIAWLLYLQPLLDRHLSQAHSHMSSGRYGEAAAEFRQILAWAKWRRAERFNLAVAELGEAYVMDQHPDVEKLNARLDALLNESPQNPHLLVLDGIRLYHQHDIPAAEDRYRQAVKLASDLAEAWFNLGVLHEDPDEAEPWFQKAQELAPGSAVYRDARAAVDLERGRYERAIERYEAIDRYPLAKLEQAKAYWALGKLDWAESRQNQALAWLNDEAVAALPWNQYPWDLAMGGQTVSLRTLGCKRYYAALALAATRYLRGGQEETPAPGDCGHALEARQAVAEDLRRYAGLTPTQTGSPFVARLPGQADPQ